MRIGFYLRFVTDSLRKNKRLYIPYILTCVGMVMMYYIIVFMQYSDTLRSLRGGETLGEILRMGSVVIAFFAGIFLFYTNSFLMRRRKKEFGLYHILGMDRRNLVRILFFETLLIAVISIVSGVALGILLSKAAELGLVNVMKGSVTFSMSVSPDAIVQSVRVFGAIFVLLFLYSFLQLRFMSATALLRSENAGEKPPKGNFVFGILGVLLLAGAYYIAVTIENPLMALVMFLLAVLMVIAGTYLLMIAGSVFFCRMLQKCRGYYYRPEHFVSVSQMAYRMRRNGAGLASICVLATMVLVMISSTASLYFGEEDTVGRLCPSELNMTCRIGSVNALGQADFDGLRAEVEAISEEFGGRAETGYDYVYAQTAGYLTEGTVETDVRMLNRISTETYENVYVFTFLSLADYNRLTGKSEVLDDGEALLYISDGDYSEPAIAFNQGERLTIRGYLTDFDGITRGEVMTMPDIMLVVPDVAEAVGGLKDLADYNGDPMVQVNWYYGVDTGLTEEEQIELGLTLQDRLRAEAALDCGFEDVRVESRAYQRGDFYGTYGGLFYLGITLSIVFVCAAVLIIYYKQLSEGYEDQARFTIMQKIGMTRREIRRSINSQLLTVFFLPFALALCHMLFAFPIIRRMLLMFHLNNVLLFARTTGLCFLLFTLFYVLVYRITSNAYYQIVSGPQSR